MKECIRGAGAFGEGCKVRAVGYAEIGLGHQSDRAEQAAPAAPPVTRPWVEGPGVGATAWVARLGAGAGVWGEGAGNETTP